MTGEEVRWGAENLNLDAAKIKALGFGDTVQPIKTSCRDHEGVARGRIHTWDGKEWSYTSDWYEADQQVPAPADRGVGQGVRGGEEDHAARLLEGEVARKRRSGRGPAPPAFPT